MTASLFATCARCGMCSLSSRPVSARLDRLGGPAVRVARLRDPTCRGGSARRSSRDDHRLRLGGPGRDLRVTRRANATSERAEESAGAEHEAGVVDAWSCPQWLKTNSHELSSAQIKSSTAATFGSRVSGIFARRARASGSAPRARALSCCGAHRVSDRCRSSGGGFARYFVHVAELVLRRLARERAQVERLDAAARPSCRCARRVATAVPGTRRRAARDEPPVEADERLRDRPFEARPVELLVDVEDEPVERAELLGASPRR